MEPRTDAPSVDTRWTVAPAVLVSLAGALTLIDRALDGTALTVVRIVLLIALITATAWTGSLLSGRTREERR